MNKIKGYNAHYQHNSYVSLLNCDPLTIEAAYLRIINEMTRRKDRHIESLFATGRAVVASLLLDVHNQYDNAIKDVFSGALHIDFLGEKYWIEGIEE